MRPTLLILLWVLCLSAQAAKQCGVISRSCTAGPATVVIDGMEVTRPCWRNTIQYACIEGSVSDTCSTSIAQGCHLASTICEQGVTINGKFECITEQREYSCKVAEATSSAVVDCGAQKFCIQGNCFDIGSVPDPDFAKAVTGMEVAREAGVYIDEHSLQLFKGQDNRCSKTVLQNCCKGASAPTNGLTNMAIDAGSAYVFDVLGGSAMKSTLTIAGFDPTSYALSIAIMVVKQMLACNSTEVLVAVKRDHRLCHYVGEYCSRKINLLLAKICVQHKETYCCFNSKLARIINEGARTQLTELNWGSPENPSCLGISIDQFQALDLSRIDFSEFYADIMPATPDQGAVQQRAQQKVNSYFGH